MRGEWPEVGDEAPYAFGQTLGKNLLKPRAPGIVEDFKLRHGHGSGCGCGGGALDAHRRYKFILFYLCVCLWLFAYA